MSRHGEDRVVLVTGSGRRTGRALAVALATDAATVVIQSRSGRGADDAVAEVRAAGADSYALTGNVTDEADARAMVDEILDRSGRLDVLVNNVGHFEVAAINEVSLASWRDQIEAAATSCFVMSRAALPGMVARGYGRIVNIADSGADHLRAVPNLTPYMIGKTGVLILTKSLAVAYASHDVTVNAVSPGIIENSVTKPPGGTDSIPKGRYAEIDEIAAAIRYFLSPGADYVTGANLKVGGGWHA